jgi:hypothetical protein
MVNVVPVRGDYIAITSDLWSKMIKSYKKKLWRPQSKKKKRAGKNLSPRNRKAYHSISIALLQSVAEIGTRSTTKNCGVKWY